MSNDNKQIPNEQEQKDILEPVVLGTVKKGKTGKPILAIFIIILIGLLVYFLPVIGDYFGDKSIIDLIKNGELIDFIKNKNNQNKPTNDTNINNDYILIGNNENINTNNLIISDIALKDNVLSYDIKSTIATYDATNENLYLQIFVDKETLVYTKALDEVFTINKKSVKENVSFYKNNSQYYAKIVNIHEEDIDDINLSTDESGLASIICTKNNDIYEYIFQKKELIEMKRTYQYKYDEDKSAEYQKTLMVYRDLVNERQKYMIEANISEDIVGFTYKEDIKLESADISTLGNNYYQYKSLAKVILFKQEAKGFDCE